MDLRSLQKENAHHVFTITCKLYSLYQQIYKEALFRYMLTHMHTHTQRESKREIGGYYECFISSSRLQETYL